MTAISQPLSQSRNHCSLHQSVTSRRTEAKYIFFGSVYVDKSPNLVFGDEPLLIKTTLLPKFSTGFRKLNFELVQSFQSEIQGISVILEDFILKLSNIFAIFALLECFLHPSVSVSVLYSELTM